MGQRLRALLASPAFIVLAALSIRAGLFWYSLARTPLTENDILSTGFEVGRVARSLVLGKGFASPLDVNSGPTAWVAPTYALTLAAVFKLFGVYTYASSVAAVLVNCVFSALVCWPMYRIGARVFGRGVGIGAAWAWAFLPSAIYVALAWVWDTSASALLLSFIFLATLKVASSERFRDWVAYGLLWALGGLTNPAMLTLSPFMIAWAAMQEHRQAKRNLRLAAAACLTFVLATLPWVVRSYVLLGEVVPIRSNFGLEFWLGNNEMVSDVWTPYRHPNENETELRHFKDVGELLYMAEKRQLATEFVATHPAAFLHHAMSRVIDNWTGTWGPPQRLLAQLTWPRRVANSLFSFLAFSGLFLAWRRSRAAWLFASALLMFPLPYYVTHTALRYRHPVDPLMTIVAVYAVSCIAAIAPSVTRHPE